MEIVQSAERCVLFATPTFDKSVSVDFHSSMLSTVAEMVRNRIPYAQRVIAGKQFIDLARNELVDYFLHSPEGFTDLFFIDADEGWDPKAVTRFLRYEEGVVCGLPPKKTIPIAPAFHDNALTGIIQNGLLQALEGGTGFMRIRREVFGRMDAHFPHLADHQKDGWPHTPYFQTGNSRYGWIGEDMFFCRQLVDMGEFAWIDANVDFTHRGSYAWKGNFYQHLINTGKLRVAKGA